MLVFYDIIELEGQIAAQIVGHFLLFQMVYFTISAKLSVISKNRYFWSTFLDKNRSFRKKSDLYVTVGSYRSRIKKKVPVPNFVCELRGDLWLTLA